MSRVGRNFGLDLARSLAISLVYVSHSFTALRSLSVGVDLFFLLSGFLIGRVYLRTTEDRTFTFWTFWRSRWWRTLPPYFAAIGIAYLLGRVGMPGSIHDIRWYYLAFLQNYLGVVGLSVTWSLCVEEHFYLALPFLGAIALRLLGRRSLIWALPLAALVPQLLRTWAFFHGGLARDWFWMTHFHCEGLILGVFLAYLYVDRPDLWLRLRPMAVVLSAVPVLLLFDLAIRKQSSAQFDSVIFLLWSLGFAGWVRLSYDLQWSPVSAAGVLLKRAIRGLALCSYSVYLIHTLLFSDLRVLLAAWPRGPIKSLTIFVVTLPICVLFYLAVERPTLQLRDRYLKRQGVLPDTMLPATPALEEPHNLSPVQPLPTSS